LEPAQVLHVGDDPERDWKAATAAGLAVFQLERPKNSLRDLLKVGAIDANRPRVRQLPE
jgi:FMN phosphatase YigB (HAD superfamily)